MGLEDSVRNHATFSDYHPRSESYDLPKSESVKREDVRRPERPLKGSKVKQLSDFLKIPAGPIPRDSKTRHSYLLDHIVNNLSVLGIEEPDNILRETVLGNDPQTLGETDLVILTRDLVYIIEAKAGRRKKGVGEQLRRAYKHLKDNFQGRPVVCIAAHLKGQEISYFRLDVDKKKFYPFERQLI